MEIQLIMLFLLLFPLVESSCKLKSEDFGNVHWECQGNDTSGVPSNTVTLTVRLDGTAIDLKPMTNLKKLTSLELFNGVFYIFQSSDFAAFPKLKKLHFRTNAKSNDAVFNFTHGLESLEDLRVDGYNVGTSIASASFNAIPSLKSLKLESCNLYEFPITGVISNIHVLELYDNPELDLNKLKYERFNNLDILKLSYSSYPDIPINVTTIKRLPNSLKELNIKVNEPLNSNDFVHLTQLRKLHVYSTVDFTFSTFSTMLRLTDLTLTYLNKTTTNITLTISNCPASLSSVAIFALSKDFRLLDNTCSVDLNLRITNDLPCNCELYYKLKLKTDYFLYKCHRYTHSKRKLASKECWRSCTPEQTGGYKCVGNDTSEVPPNTTTLTVELAGSDVDLRSMKHLTELTNLKLFEGGFHVFQSSDLAIFPKLKKLVLARHSGKRYEFGSLKVLNLTGGLETLQHFEITRQNVGASVTSANWDTIPNLKVLRLSECNLTNLHVTRVISNVDELVLSYNPDLNLSALPYERFNNLTILNLLVTSALAYENKIDPSKLRKFPNSLEELSIVVKQPLNSEDFLNLTQLRKLYVASTADFKFSTFSPMSSLIELTLDYRYKNKNIITLPINLAISNCPTSLSKVVIDAKYRNLRSLQVRTTNNTCSDSLDLQILSSWDKCDCGVYTNLKSKLDRLVYKCERTTATAQCEPVLKTSTSPATTTTKSPTTSLVDSSALSNRMLYHWITMFLALVALFKLVP